MEICVNDYIRTNNGVIRKIKLIRKDCVTVDKVYRRYGYLTETVWNDNIVKYSKNIIDLIQEGDIVNGCVVVTEKYTYIEMNFINIDSEISYGWGAGAIPENEIKTILTKEQYEQNSYKL